LITVYFLLAVVAIFEQLNDDINKKNKINYVLSNTVSVQ